MDITAELNEFSKTVVTRILGRDVTQGELARAFDKVAPASHWKNPIDALVVISNDFEMELLRSAITFFTGSVARFEIVAVITNCGVSTGSARYRVRAAGYYATIGA